MEVYEKIKFMRQLKGKSQEFMAEQLGMSVNMVIQILNVEKQTYRFLEL